MLRQGNGQQLLRSWTCRPSLPFLTVQMQCTQVLHAGDIICEGFVRPLKGATPAGASKAAAAPQEADGAPGQPRQPAEAEWAHPEAETVGSLHFYNAVSRMGLCYGPQFRMVQKLNAAADTAAQLRSAPLPPMTPQLIKMPALG